MEENRPHAPTGRSMVYTKGGLVCSASPLAASAGVEVLKAGGNAFDASVAVAAVEGVTVTPMCGLGGEPFALLYHAKTGRLYGLNGSGAAPKSASRDYFLERGYKLMPSEGPLSVAIPGEVDTFATILEKFGTMPLDRLLEPAIGYAEEGYPVPPRMAVFFQQEAPKLNRFRQSAAIFTKNGAPYREGDLLVQKDLAKSLRRVARGGAEEFYRGDLGRELAAAIQQAGGLYTSEELSAHGTVLYDNPISTTYRGLDVYQTSLPSHGLLTLELLNIIERFDIKAMGFNSAQSIHVMAEAKKLAYADRLAHVGDPDFVKVPADELLSKEYAARRSESIDPQRASARVTTGALYQESPTDNTSYFCVVDGEGNAVSFIHSLSHIFGSGFTAGGTGILLNNRVGRGFSLEEGHPNVIEPGGKRTMHTLNAYMVFKDGLPYLVGGTPGGDAQPQWNVQVVSSVIDIGLNVQQAAEAPRWMSTPGTDPPTVHQPYRLALENGIPGTVVEELKRMGHDAARFESAFGGAVQLIMVDHERGLRMGGSDPRADGHASAT